MKTLKGNGADVTILKGAINPGSNLAIESATLQDVNVYGGTLTVPGGVVLDGTATTSGTAAVEFTGGTFGANAYVNGSTNISSAVMGGVVNVPSVINLNYVGVGDAVVDMAHNRFFVSNGGRMSALGITFSGGSTTNAGVFRVSGGSMYFSGCSFLNNSTNANGVFYQQVNAGRMEFVDCVIDKIRATSNVAVAYRVNNGYMRFAHCSITGATARTYPVAYYTNGGSFRMSNCVVASNSMTNSGGAIAYSVGSSSIYESCVFSNNYDTHATHAGRVFVLGATVTMTDCQVDQIISSPLAAIYTSATCILTISGGTCSTIQNLGTTNLAGTVSIGYLSSGTVNITSGTSISLTSNMSCTAINVDGGCTVNGAVVSAGTYTNIDSTGRAT